MPALTMAKHAKTGKEEHAKTGKARQEGQTTYTAGYWAETRPCNQMTCRMGDDRATAAWCCESQFTNRSRLAAAGNPVLGVSRRLFITRQSSVPSTYAICGHRNKHVSGKAPQQMGTDCTTDFLSMSFKCSCYAHSCCLQGPPCASWTGCRPACSPAR